MTHKSRSCQFGPPADERHGSDGLTGIRSRVEAHGNPAGAAGCLVGAVVIMYAPHR
ncbi:hypothetical protein OG320_24765 [Microbispora sp. NBC_01189]|uniref:hypothetical protein n=1 Tax=Microbispora sp. NBC_01189 TaxID=2903583 RepID=UPI002E10F7D4|nr:hypothetical protein OG320_24765 [Microbispora sp. NBC_01189]